MFQKTINGSFTGFRRKVAIEDVIKNNTSLHNDESIMEDPTPFKRQNFASLASSQDDNELNELMERDIQNKVEIHLNKSIEAGRRTQKLATKGEERKNKQLETKRVSNLAKTQADGGWK